MDNQFFALLVYDPPQPLESLKDALRELSVETYCVRTCQEAQRLIPQTQPHLIFTDVLLPDGSWVDVLRLAEEAEAPLNVIVVGAPKDIRLYVTALERGAYDLLLPPFERQSLKFVVESAGKEVLLRRYSLARAAVA